MSRAFVKEDGEAEEIRERIEQERRLEEWLAIQEKKLHFLLSDPKAGDMDQEKRQEWIEDTRNDMAKTRETLMELRKVREGKNR